MIKRMIKFVLKYKRLMTLIMVVLPYLGTTQECTPLMVMSTIIR